MALLMAIDNPANAKPAAPMAASRSFAANRDVESAALSLADALYPVVRQLDAKTVAPLASKLVAQAMTRVGRVAQLLRT